MIALKNVEAFFDRCAVFIKPEDEELRRLEKEYGESLSPFMQEENNSSIQIADSILAWKSIRTYYTDKKSLEFIKMNGSSVTLQPSELNGWDLILFDPYKDPKVISSIDMLKEMRYFDN
jgi:hypothetical protein